MIEAKECLKCKEIITFCECKKSITDKDKYIDWLESQLKKMPVELLEEMIEGLNELNGEFQEGWQPIIDQANEYLQTLKQ